MKRKRKRRFDKRAAASLAIASASHH